MRSKNLLTPNLAFVLLLIFSQSLTKADIAITSIDKLVIQIDGGGFRHAIPAPSPYLQSFKLVRADSAHESYTNWIQWELNGLDGGGVAEDFITPSVGGYFAEASIGPTIFDPVPSVPNFSSLHFASMTALANNADGNGHTAAFESGGVCLFSFLVNTQSEANQTITVSYGFENARVAATGSGVAQLDVRIWDLWSVPPWGGPPLKPLTYTFVPGDPVMIPPQTFRLLDLPGFKMGVPFDAQFGVTLQGYAAVTSVPEPASIITVAAAMLLSLGYCCLGKKRTLSGLANSA